MVVIGHVRLVLALGAQHPCEDAHGYNHEEADDEGPPVGRRVLAWWYEADAGG